MTAATLNKVNAAIAHHHVELVKGEGYFYFAALNDAAQSTADQIASVYSNQLRCMSLEAWIAYVEEHARVTFAKRFIALAADLMPHMDTLQDLDPAIDDANHIDEIMFRRSELVGGMAAVIIALVERQA